MRFCEGLGRTLLGLSTLLFLACPWTESVSNLDSFPRGGQDFELSVFLLLTLLCMSLLAALGNLSRAEQLITEQAWMHHDLWARLSSQGEQGRIVAPVWVPPKQPFFGGSVPLPLRI